MRTVSGHVVMSRQMFEATQRTEAVWSRLERTAANYTEASDEDRTELDRVLAAIDARDDWDDD